MTDALDAELDRLFRLPPAELVEARNALADTLRRAGDKAAAARVKAIKRAVPVAWALNQVWFSEPALLERARELTEALRALHGQAGVEARRLAGAVEAQRIAMQAAVEAAMHAGRDAGMSEATLQQRKVFTTLQAWLAGKGDEAPGRMTHELEASGFDAFAGMSVLVPVAAGPVTPAAQAAPSERESAEHDDRAAIVEARRRAAELEQRAAAALERVQTRATEHTAAQQARDQAQASVREAERQLAELRAMLEQRSRELERRAAALDEARAQHEQAQAAARAARAVTPR